MGTDKGAKSYLGVPYGKVNKYLTVSENGTEDCGLITAFTINKSKFNPREFGIMCMENFDRICKQAAGDRK